MFRNNKKVLGIFLFLSILIIPVVSNAQYDPLAVGLDELYVESAGLSSFFSNLFGIALTIGSMLAVLVIAISGLQYMTTEAATDKTHSKERMQQAVLGLLMLLSVWLFFNEINPEILDLDLQLSPVRTIVTPQSDESARAARNPIIPGSYTGTSYDITSWSQLSPGETCSQSKNESGWVLIDIHHCPGSKPSSNSQCCGKNSTIPSNPVTNNSSPAEESYYSKGEESTIPSGSWCYENSDGSGTTCYAAQDDCEATTDNSCFIK